MPANAVRALPRELTGKRGTFQFVINAAAAAEEELRRLNDGAFDEAGVDLTQIDMMLMLTPAERLSVLYESAASLAQLMDHADADPKF